MKYKLLVFLFIFFWFFTNAHAYSVLGMKIYSKNTNRITFYVENTKKIDRFVRYFLTAITIPERMWWVNLSPYEPYRIMPQGLSQTIMGKDMLSQDRALKNFVASLFDPRNDIGKLFWKDVYAKGLKNNAALDNVIQKIWIVPHSAELIENENEVKLINAQLAVRCGLDQIVYEQSQNKAFIKDYQIISSVMQKRIMPYLEKEINEGKTFQQLREIYSAMILATWYKQRTEHELMKRYFVDQVKTNFSIQILDKRVIIQEYQKYLSDLKRGVVNIIQVEKDLVTGVDVTRHYFSGGEDFAMITREILHVLKQEDDLHFPDDIIEVHVDLKAKFKSADNYNGSKFLEHYSHAKEILKEALIKQDRTVDGHIAIGLWDDIEPRVGSIKVISDVFYTALGVKPLFDQSPFVLEHEIYIDIIDDQLALMIRSWKKKKWDYKAFIQALEKINRDDVLNFVNSDQAMIRLVDADVIGHILEQLRVTYKNPFENRLPVLVNMKELLSSDLNHRLAIAQWVVAMSKENNIPLIITKDKNDRLVIAMDIQLDKGSMYVSNEVNRAGVWFWRMLHIRCQLPPQYKIPNNIIKALHLKDENISKKNVKGGIDLSLMFRKQSNFDLKKNNDNDLEGFNFTLRVDK